MISHMAKIFADVSEKEITRTIAEMFSETMREYTDSDVIIIGAGPAGLTAGRDLAREGVRTLIIEQNNYLGGGYWVGGYMMNPVTVRADRKSTRLNSSHANISYAVFCLKKKK